MEEDIKGLQDYLQIFKRFRRLMLLTVLLVTGIGAIVAYKLPSIYKSTATILIEQQEIPRDLVRSTITSFADQRIQMISQRVMNSENLTAIMNKFNLFTKERQTATSAALLEKMRADINLEIKNANVVDPQSGRPTQVSIAFSLTFKSDSPKMAQQVAGELATLYLNENLKNRNQAVAETTDFLALEAEKLKAHIAELEAALASFREEHASSLPEVQQLNMQMMDRNEQQLNDIDRQINALTERKSYLEAELAQINPTLPHVTSTGERVYGSKDRLTALDAEYVTLLAKYSPSHPDVVKMRRQMAALEHEVGTVDNSDIEKQLRGKRMELSELRERYSDDHPDVKRLQKTMASLESMLNIPVRKPRRVVTQVDNPAYIQLKSQLHGAKVEISSLYASKQRIIAKIAHYEKGLRAAPQVQRKYNDLSLDYDNSMHKYREIKAKQMEADMAKTMEKDKKGERFSLIDPPRLPEEPFTPNRPAIIGLGFILSLGSALGVALFKASLDAGIYGEKALRAIVGTPPLMVIPVLTNRKDQLKTMQVRWGMLGLLMLLVLGAVLLLHLVVMPLDVLWYTVLRKLQQLLV